MVAAAFRLRNPNGEEPMEQESDLILHRKEKLKKLKEKSIDPYPYSFKRTHLSSEIIGTYEKLEGEEAEVKIAGRIVSLRLHGKSLFAHLQDGAGKI
jgi:lysyl-tRNA synthetase class 2